MSEKKKKIGGEYSAIEMNSIGENFRTRIFYLIEMFHLDKQQNMPKHMHKRHQAPNKFFVSGLKCV